MQNNKQLDLCCCEYVDRNGERYHLLGCCCNCIDCDQVFDRLLICKPASGENLAGMLLTFQDRIRVPWQGGAKRVAIDAALPVFLIPLLFGVGAINLYCCLLICIMTPLFLGYCYFYLRKVAPRSRFFFMWTIWTVVYLLFLFEFTVPLLELLPEENFILIVFVCLSLLCLFQTKVKAKLNFITESSTSDNKLSSSAEDDLLLTIDEEAARMITESNICPSCRKHMPPNSFHCHVCQTCIICRNHHSIWLDCCIGLSNHKYYMFGLSFGLLALLFGSNLTLTSICHPFVVVQIRGMRFLLPNDCTEVFDQYETGLSFIVSIYSILIAVFICFALTIQIFLISRGLTFSEWRSGRSGNRKTVLNNWKSFLC